jgi:hypothetical protein
MFVNMKGQNVFTNEVRDFNLETYSRLLKEDLVGFVEYLSQFSKRKVKIKEASIKIDRQLLFKWKTGGLLPFRAQEPMEKKSWARFSFIELCWLKVLLALRQQGVGFDHLKKIKQKLFDEDILNELFQRITLEEIKENAPDFADLAEKEGFIVEGKFIKIDTSDEIYEGHQISLFTCLIYSAMLLNGTVVLYIDDKGTLGFLDIAEIKSRPIAGVERIYNILNVPSLTFVNLKLIVEELSKSQGEVPIK